MWQALYEELAPAGLEIVTVALDTDREAARPFVDAATPTHPSLVDEALSMVDQFGITNVPFALWIDESGTIVRPAEVAFAQHPQRAASDDANERQAAAIAQMPEKQRVVVEAMTKAVDRTGRYTEAIRDWVAHGADSRFVLSPDEVVARSVRGQRSSGSPPRTSSSASTCTAPASPSTRSRTSARRTDSTRRTGATRATP